MKECFQMKRIEVVTAIIQHDVCQFIVQGDSIPNLLEILTVRFDLS